jgi:MoaA/NifB/PqqE/SkfB family radical SAM enzyme
VGNSATTFRTAFDRSQPTAAYLELTYRCNWRCVFCYNPRHSDIRRMSAAEWTHVLDDLRSIGAFNVTLTGGEPLTHPEFFAIVEAARERSFAVRLFTNGSLIDETVARRLASLYVTSVEMSLHGATAATHEAATLNQGSFEALLAAVAHLKSAGISPRLKAPVTRLNEHEIDGMLALARDLDVTFRLDAQITPRDDGSLEPLSYRASADAIRRVMQIAADTGSLHKPGIEDARANCGLGRTTLAIDPDGNVYPCMQWRQSALGNVRETRLADLWPSSAMRREMAGVAERTAGELRKVGGDALEFPFCPALAAQHTGDPYAITPEFLERARLAREARAKSGSPTDPS